MRIFVIHPGKQHSFQLATALKKKNVLGKYITSVYNKPRSLTYFLLKIVSGDIYKKIRSRRCEKIQDTDVKQFNEWKVIFTLFLNHFPSIQKIAEYWNEYTESSFYKKTMKFVLREHPDAIIIYNGYSNKHLEYIKGKGIVKIMDMSIAKREYIQKILQQEIDDTGISAIKDMHFSYWNKKMLNNDIKGCNDIDYFLVPSQFVKDSLLENGIKEAQIKMVPYGVDIKQFNPTLNNKAEGKLKLIFVGSITYRKGIHRLLHVIKEMDDVEVYLAGTYDKDSDMYMTYKECDNIHFLGFVTRDKLNALYNKCEVFVLPSFCEGMAMVGLEAMACGLPLICSKYTGVNDVIIDGKNGFVYDANDEITLKKHINWFLQNRDQISDMGNFSRKTAIAYSWENYHERVYNAIIECINHRWE